MPAFGTKRTLACALHMSAFDPKRTSAQRSLSMTLGPSSKRSGTAFQARAFTRAGQMR